MNSMGVPDAAAGPASPEVSTLHEGEAVPSSPGAGDSSPAAADAPPGANPEEPARRNMERALGGSMLKSMLASSLAARGGNWDGQPATRIASAVNIAADAIRQAAPALKADGRQSAAAAMEALLTHARAVMASRPDLAAAAGALPGDGSGGTAPAVDLRDWDTRKADEARDAFLVTALRLVTDACFNLAAAAGGNPVLPGLATDLAVHLERLKPELAAPGPSDGNSSTGVTGFPAFVSELRDLVATIRK